MGETTRYQYDSSNWADTVTDPQGRVTPMTITLAAISPTRPIRPASRRHTPMTAVRAGSPGILDTTGHTTTYSYSSGELTSETDSSGRTTTYTYYDPGGQLETETVTPPPGGVTTTYMYDLAGNVLSITESGGPQTVFTYDAHDRLTQDNEISYHVASLFFTPPLKKTISF